MNRLNRRVSADEGQHVARDREENRDAASHDASDASLDVAVVYEEGEPKKKMKARVGVVDVSEAIEQEARERAEEALTEKAADSGERSRTGKVKEWFGRTLRRVWKGNLFREYYRQKEIALAKADIRATGNLYAGAADKVAHDTAMNAIVERFVNDFEEDTKKDLVHAQAGERIGELEETPEGQAVRGELTALVRAYARGSMTEEQFLASKRGVFERLRQEQKKQAGEDEAKQIFSQGELFADNLLDIAKQVRDLVAHGQALEELDIDLDLTLGRAKAGARTEVEFSAVDRLTKKLTDSKLGGWLSGVAGAASTETAIASALSIASAVGATVSQSLARSRLFAFGSFGATALIAGGRAAYRESKQLERERRLHMRERAKSATFMQEEGSRRAEMESFTYETRNASDLAAELEVLVARGDNGETRELSPEQHEQLMRRVADIEARIQISDRRGVDLLSYTSAESLEEERLRLDVLRAAAKAKMRREFTGANPDADWQQLYTKIVDDRVRELSGADSEMQKRDQLFNTMRKKQTAKAFMKGVVIGAGVGIAVQEVASMFADTYGVADALKGEKAAVGSHMTGLEYMRRWMTGDLPTVQGSHIEHIAGHEIKIPDGMSLEAQSDGTFDLTADGSKEAVVSGLKLDASGQLTEDAAASLAKKGIGISSAEAVVHKTEWHPGSMEVDAYIEQHGEDMHAVSRDMWYDNDTPTYTDPLTGKTLGSDHNELKLQWGGEGGGGVDASKNYVYNVAEMTKDGSWHDVYSTDAKHLMEEGKLKLLLSFNTETQHQVFEVPVDALGNAVIDPKSDVGRLLFEDVGGRAKFLGRFAEIAEMTHTDEADVDHVRILSTHVGKGVETLTGEIPYVASGIESVTALDVPSQVDIMPPPVIPIWGRRPLENKLDGMFAGSDAISYPIVSGGVAQEYAKQIEARRSKALEQNPQKKCGVEDERTYLEHLTQEEKARVKEFSQQAGSMSKENRITVCIPVAGHQEGKNIYRTLEGYIPQTLSRDKFEIVLFVNHPKTDKSGKTIKPDNTLEEIKRFKKAYPDMPVRVIYKALPIEQAKIGFVRKALTDSVLNRHVERKDEKELLIVSNDADNTGIAPEYLENFLEKFGKHPEADGMLGQLDWDPEAYVENPVLHVGTRIFQYMSVISRHKNGYMGSSGANFAFRAGAYGAMGGYIAECAGGEVDLIGQAIVKGRKRQDAIKFAGARASRVYTSARRAVDAIKKGLAPVEQWTQGFSAFDNEVRSWQTSDARPDFDDPEYLKRLKVDVQHVLDRTVLMAKKWGAFPDMLYVIERPIRWLGIKYRVHAQEERIEVTDIDRLVKGLRQYQIDGVRMRDIKSGKRKRLGDQRAGVRVVATPPDGRLTQQTVDRAMRRVLRKAQEPFVRGANMPDAQQLGNAA